MHTGGTSSLSTQEELMFFDRTKKALESGGTYEEFLKLLNLFAKDVIDTKTLIKRSEVFLTDAELMYQFKELMGWDDKRGNIEHGPPGSIRTGAPDPAAATCPDDEEGPSYRKLPFHVRSKFFYARLERVQHSNRPRDGVYVYLILVPLLLAAMQGLLERVFLVRQEACLLGGPCRVRHPLVVENGPRQLIPP